MAYKGRSGTNLKSSSVSWIMFWMKWICREVRGAAPACPTTSAIFWEREEDTAADRAGPEGTDGAVRNQKPFVYQTFYYRTKRNSVSSLTSRNGTESFLCSIMQHCFSADGPQRLQSFPNCTKSLVHGAGDDNFNQPWTNSKLLFQTVQQPNIWLLTETWRVFWVRQTASSRHVIFVLYHLTVILFSTKKPSRLLNSYMSFKCFYNAGSQWGH